MSENGDNDGIGGFDMSTDRDETADDTNTPADWDSDGSEPTEERPDWRDKTGAAAGKVISSIPRLIPKQSRIFRAMAMNSIKQYHKRAGGDALALDARAGQQLDLTPVKYRPAGECDEGEKPGWVAKDGTHTWSAASEGRVVDYLNNTPVVALDRDSHVECGWLRPRIAEAIELDQYDGIYTNPQVNLVADAQANGQAVADGGSPSLELGSPGQWAGDALVDLDSGEGYDGMRISFRKASEWASEQTTAQEMQMQEDRGYIRGLANGDDGPGTFKLLLLCAAIILGTFAIVFIGPQLLGGGGGSINPLMIGALGSLL
jgi:hypothetical protein